MLGLRSFAVLAASAIFASSVNALPGSHYGRQAHWSGDNYGSKTVPHARSTITVRQTTTVSHHARSTITVHSTTTVPHHTRSTITVRHTTTMHGSSFPTLSVEPHHASLNGSTASWFGSAPSGVWPSGYGAPYPTASGAPYPANSSNPTTNGSKPLPGMLRGVNLGGWLILEDWMTPGVFNDTDAIDQWTFDSTDGAEAKLQQHWSTYITEDDIKQVADWGLNALRIPIGYWAYNNQGTPYIQGADVYMEKAIGWARQYGLWVLVDCHGSPGSQNGAEHSGHDGTVSWQQDNNLQLSINILETMAEKYGSMEYADVVFGIEFVNEPSTGGNNDFATTKQWAEKAERAVKSKATNTDLFGVMHDAWMGPSNWEQVGDAVNGNKTYDQARFSMDVHLYQNQDEDDGNLTIPEHINKSCEYQSTQLLGKDSTLPVFIGEFAAQIDVCAFEDGTSIGGRSCASGGYCNTGPLNQNTTSPAYRVLKNGLRQYFEAEIQTFEAASRGYFVWSLRSGNSDDSWSLYGIMDNLYEEGEKITDYKYPDICSKQDAYPLASS